MEFVILGPTALWHDDRSVPLGTAKQRALLAVLLYRVREPVRIDTIVDHLWGDRPVDACRPYLYPLVSRTRAVLRSVGLPGALVRDAGQDAYRLDIAAEAVDLRRFEQLVSQARSGMRRDERAAAVDLLYQAIGLYRGEPLADLRGARAELLRQDLHGRLLAAQKLLAENLLLIGRPDEAVAFLEPFVVMNPFDQGVARLWVAGLDAAGRVDDSDLFLVEFLRRYRKRIRREPSVDLVDLRDQIRGSAQAEEKILRPLVASVAVTARPRQLPNDIHDFTGHAALLGELDGCLGPGTGGPNVVVLTGPPGVGKTTLARHWAHRHRGRFPDGQLYLNAEGHSAHPTVRPAEALRGFLAALGVPPDRIPDDVGPRRERFNQLLNGRRVLIVLDNVHDSDQVRPLLTDSATCLTVITCRNRLKGLTIREGVRGIPVLPLAEEERRVLLGRIIGTARTDAQPAALRALARLSEGFPLALRIIGEHVVARPRASIDDLVTELSSRLLDCEGGEEPDATLRTFFAWSYRALEPSSARLFRMLGLHSGATVDAGAAGALIDTEAALAERELDILARAHLVNHDTARRYRMHDLLRRYAADCGRAEEPTEDQHAALRRLLDWYVISAANAATVLAPEHPPVQDLPAAGASAPMIFATDVDAMRWCEAERTNLMRMARLAADCGFHRHAWQIPAAVHEIFDRYGRQDDMLDMLRSVLSAAEADQHPQGQIATLVNLGATHFAMRDYANARSWYEQALRIARQVGNPDAEAVCEHNLASVYLHTGAVARAVETYRRVLRACRATGNDLGAAYTLRHLAGAYGRMKRYDRAKGYYQEALDAWARIGSPREQAITYGRLAALYLGLGQAQLALSHSLEALALHQRVRDEANLCDVRTTAADARRAMGAYADAVADAWAAIGLGQQIADAPRRARALAVLADTLAAMGDHQSAYERCQEAFDLVGDIDDPEIHEVLDRLLAVEARAARRAEAG